MSNLEHLIENTMISFENRSDWADILNDINNDVNLDYAGITPMQCFEICQYIWCDYLDNGWRLKKDEESN